MARQENRLLEFGLEGIALVDQWYGRPKRVSVPAPQMARQEDRLAEVELEGFALVDQWYGRPKRIPVPAPQEADDHTIIIA
ncbi:hypothetical protein GH714_018496 [Hevea brasiliensis]|uniref:Uncharacterized protein n=1 Tax=Hevea brasiliensis TaxID=3981 RepID=A0A6A6MMW9_HEVBR|nr:hypothetical protein GH714_018496 [Hevea brasiliensis]